MKDTKNIDELLRIHFGLDELIMDARFIETIESTDRGDFEVLIRDVVDKDIENIQSSEFPRKMNSNSCFQIFLLTLEQLVICNDWVFVQKEMQAIFWGTTTVYIIWDISNSTIRYDSCKHFETHQFSVSDGSEET